jgi:hypothetical protein
MHSMKLYLFTLFLVMQNPLLANVNCNNYSESIENQETYDSTDQLSLLCKFKKSIDEAYSKNVLTSFQEKKAEIFEKCFSEVKDEEILPNQMNGILKRCVSRFEDGHLKASIKNVTNVILPFSIIESVDGRIFVDVVQRYELCFDNFDLKVGDEILTINGESPQEFSQRYSKYISSSSVNAKRTFSFDSISHLTFDFPDSPKLSIKYLRNGEEKTTEINYEFVSNSSNPEVRSLKEKGYRQCDFYNSKSDTEGYFNSDPMYIPSWSFKNEKGKTVAWFTRNTETDVNSCYFKFKNFSDINGKVRNDNGEESPMNLFSWLGFSVKRCDSEGKPLIIDVRNNTGGSYYGLAKFLGTIIDVKGSEFPHLYFTEKEFENSGDTENPYRSIDFFLSANSFEISNFNRVLYSLTDRIRLNDYSYQNKIILLTGPDCYSSCDITSLFLRQRENTIVIGQSSQGAYNGISNMDVNKYKNDNFTYYDFKTNIATFHYFEEPNNESIKYGRCVEGLDFCLIPLEGHQIEVDIPYATSEEDLIGDIKGQGWLKRVDQALSI